MAEEQTKQKKDRLIFIDVMRGIAVLWMIETHVVDACLNSYFKSGLIYDYLNISNGFVAVSFIFCAGAGFWLAALKKADDYKKFKPSLWVYLRRLGYIFLIGYWLHLPAMSLSKMFQVSYPEMLRFLDFDVLQEIVFASLVSLIILMIVPKSKMKFIPYVFALLTLFVFAYAPIVWTTNPIDFMPVFFGTMFTKYPVSKFPVFPWSGYFFAGAAITSFFFNAKDKVKFSRIVAASCVVLWFIIFYLKGMPFTAYGFNDWWRCSPGHSLYRVTVAIFVFCVLYLIEDIYKHRTVGSFLKLSGQESLYMYVLHLMIVYGSISNSGMRQYINGRLGIIETIIVFLTVTAVTYYTAKAWNLVKLNYTLRSKQVIYAVGIGFLIIFAVNPY